MRYLSFLSLCLLIVLAPTGCGPKVADSPTSNTSEADEDSQLAFKDGELKLGEPIRHENLEIFPVLSDKPQTDDLYITLDEGLKSGVIEIREVGGGSSEAPNQQIQFNPANIIGDDIIIDLNPSQNPGEALDPIPVMPPVEPADVPAQPELPTDNEANDPVDPFDSDTVEELDGLFGEVVADDTEAEVTPQVAADNDEFAGLYEDLEPAPVADNSPDDEDEGLQQQSQEFLDQVESQQEIGNAENLPEFSFSQLSNQQIGGGNQVNRVVVVNNGDKPLYLMPGEIIIGGDQDRTIGRELVIAPDGKPVEVEVFCVEQGRWGNRGQLTVNDAETIASVEALQSSTALLPAGDLVQLGDGSDRFVGSVGNLSSKARLAVQHGKDQSEVWDEVGKLNAKNPVQRESSAFTANYTEADNVESLVPYIEKLQKPIQNQQQIVGVVVAINGKPVTADVFRSTPLFQKLWPKLLKSYALEAATSRLDDDGKPIKATGCPNIHACEFITSAYAAPITGEDNSGRVAVSTRENQTLVTFQSMATESSDLNAEATPAVQAEIHLNAIAK